MNKLVRRQRERLRNTVRQWLTPEVNTNTERDLDVLNTRSMHYISTITLAIETVVLILYVLIQGRDAFGKNIHATSSVFLAVAVCGLTSYLSHSMLKEYEDHGRLSHKQASTLLVVFYLTLTVWSMIASFRHYVRDEQIVTFYVVEFCFVCFFAMKPKLSIPLVIVTYSCFFILLVLYNPAWIPHPVNYTVFMLLAAAGTVARYHLQVEMVNKRYEVEKLNVLLKDSAMHDELTGMKNRHALRDDFHEYQGRDLDVIMIDIDYFKHFNDQYGHLEGDGVIQEIAESLMDAFTKGACYRYGGDEFLIILPETEEEEYRTRLERWQKSLSSIRIDGIEEPVTCSYGHVHGKAENDVDLRAMIQKADELLYTQKNDR